MRLDRDTLKQIIHEVITTRPDEISCGQCFDHLDHFAEITLVGKNASEAMPLVQDHLEHCRECKQEFEALLLALKGFESEPLPPGVRDTTKH
jgi:hypothetical protein